MPSRPGLLLAASTILAGLATQAQALDVVASIKPVHSLVAAVMEGVGQPELLVKGAASPHSYSLRPSEARALENAALIFWVGHDMEVFLDKPLETLGGGARIVELADAHDLVRLDFREGGTFESHDHGGDHDDHGHGKGAGHAHDEATHDDHDADDGHGHGHEHDHVDMHFWLDPMNAKVFVREIEAALAEADPDNASAYEANASSVSARLDALIEETQAAIAPARGKGFIVFHDAYHYYENRFGISASGSITVSPEALPGAQRIAEIRSRVEELGATCVFAEPQFEPSLVAVVTEGTGARAGVLDPLGADLEDGPELYFDLIRGITTSLTTCLAEAS